MAENSVMAVSSSKRLLTNAASPQDVLLYKKSRLFLLMYNRAPIKANKITNATVPE